MDLEKINLKYLMNRTNYEKYAILNPVSQTEYIEDKEFYRKRIVDFTKKMFKETDETNNTNTNINRVFESYVKHLIVHFKELDRKDILQNDYNDVDFSKSNKIPKEYINADPLIFNEKEQTNTLDGFIIVNNKNTGNNGVVLPLKREINLKDPKLMKKGIIYRDVKTKKQKETDKTNDKETDKTNDRETDKTNDKDTDKDKDKTNDKELEEADTIDIIYKSKK